MTETAGGGPGAEQRCPWCSTLAPADAERCPSCGAALREVTTSAEDLIPGVTHVDPVLGQRRQLPRPNRLVGWLADVDTEAIPTIDRTTRAAAAGGGAEVLQGTDATSVAPPSEEVRREMRRLELEAIKAELEERAAEARLAALDAGQDRPAPADSLEAPAQAEPTPADPPAGEGAAGA